MRERAQGTSVKRKKGTCKKGMKEEAKVARQQVKRKKYKKEGSFRQWIRNRKRKHRRFLNSDLLFQFFPDSMVSVFTLNKHLDTKTATQSCDFFQLNILNIDQILKSIRVQRLSADTGNRVQPVQLKTELIVFQFEQ